MKIAIVGFGIQGRSVYDYYKDTDNELTICDSSHVDNLPANVKTHFGKGHLDNLGQYDLIYRSPGIHPNQLIASNGSDILAKVTTNSNEFLNICPTKNIIGVTGTKGKGTTSSLITKILQGAGFKVHLGGNNIGRPPLDLLNENIKADDWVVLELANFQLIDLRHSPHIAVCLIVEPEHLDWHPDIDDYYLAKTQLFKHQSKEDIAIYYAKNNQSKLIASTSVGKLVPYLELPGAIVDGPNIKMEGQEIVRLDELNLPGEHNWQNVCAAVTAIWQITQDVPAIRAALKDFKSLPFRIEEVRQVSDVSYVDDSFASAPTAVIAAIEAVKQPKVLIIGGKDRGLSLNQLVRSIKDQELNMRKVILIGESADRLDKELKKVGFDNTLMLGLKVSMTDIVQTACGVARKGDAVLLSPGFPSFDMFKNFEDRGRQFNEAVSKL